MTSKSEWQSCAADMTKCPICLEIFSNPRSLPCLHTFCLDCIKQHYHTKLPGDEVACPVCRKNFSIPGKGLDELVHNFMIQSLMDSKKISSEAAPSDVSCEVCSLETNDSDADVVPSATVLCVDCNQKLCEQCSRPHRRWPRRAHKVIPLGSEIQSQLFETRASYCEKHVDEIIKLWCFDCKINICLMCFVLDHQQHLCQEIGKVAKQCVQQIDKDLQPVSQCISDIKKQAENLKNESDKLMKCIRSVEMQIDQTAKELKQLIDRHASALKVEVQLAKAVTFKEIKSHNERIEMALLAMESFCMFCTELKSNGNPSDITRAAKGLSVRANELLQTDVKSFNYCAPYITFRPTNIEELMSGGQNTIGLILTTETTNTETVSTNSTIPFTTQIQRELEFQLEKAAGSQKTLQKELDKQNMRVKELEELTNAASENIKILLVERDEALNNLNRELVLIVDERNKLHKEVENLRQLAKNLEDELSTLKLALKQTAEELDHVKRMECLLKEHFQSAPQVIATLPDCDAVWGITTLENEVYVLRNKSKQELEVYSTSTYKLLRYLSIKGLKSTQDMTACKQNRCIYISDDAGQSVHRVEPRGKIVKWSVYDEPARLSVTSKFNVLVTCDEVGKLKEFTTVGDKVREINLQSDIVNPWHAIELSNGQFVVCHGKVDDPVRRVCKVDSSGRITQFYGEIEGSAIVGQLNVPLHLAVDADEFIYVVDVNNRRVLLLSPTLSFARLIVSRNQLKWKPRRLHLDAENRHLYVADNNWSNNKFTSGQVVVFDLQTII